MHLPDSNIAAEHLSDVHWNMNKRNRTNAGFSFRRMKACPAACNGRDVASAISRGTCNHECSWNNHIPSQEAIDKRPAPEKTLSRQWSRLCTPRPREQKLRNRNHMKAVEYANHTYSKRDQNKGFPAHHSMKAAKFVVFSSIHHLSYRKKWD